MLTELDRSFIKYNILIAFILLLNPIYNRLFLHLFRKKKQADN